MLAKQRVVVFAGKTPGALEEREDCLDQGVFSEDRYHKRHREFGDPSYEIDVPGQTGRVVVRERGQRAERGEDFTLDQGRISSRR